MTRIVSPIQDCPSAASYLERIGATWKTLFTAAIVINLEGYEKEVHRITFNREGEVRAPKDLEPTAAEAEGIQNEIAKIELPEQQHLTALSNSNLPDLIKNALDEDLFVFWTKDKKIEFIQVRVDKDDGDKRYVPHTYWSDGVWRNIEPEKGLPLYGIDKVRHGDRIFLHEGAKSARAGENIADNPAHPWSEFFKTGKHVGWCGGSHYYFKNRWHELGNMPSEAIIIPDNDFVGMTAVSKISGRLPCPCKYLRLDNSWPKSWDVADEIPVKFYLDGGEYNGPKFEDLLSYCDWATDSFYIGDKLHFKIREKFAESWVRVQRTKQYVNLQDPEAAFDKEQFNIQVRPYSDVADTASLFSKLSGNICQTLVFLPGRETGLIYHEDEYKLNQYKDRRIRPRAGDNEPFWKFFKYLFPIESERNEIFRWMATLYAKPEVRIGYAILLLSKLQGVGKSTFLTMLADLIGRKHTSFPGDAAIQSDFNSWLINKRLVVVHEIYAGQNWKVYNRLKSLITDDSIDANMKHVSNYSLPLVAHFAAASNSLEALRIEHDDRRWFVPTLPEQLYDDYEGLRKWMVNGGLSSLAQELNEFDNYVGPGETAPGTEAKVRLIDQSMPTDERMVFELAKRMSSGECMDVNEIWLWLQGEIGTRAYVTPQRIQSLLSERGFHLAKEQALGNDNTIVWKSEEDRKKSTSADSSEQETSLIVSCLKTPSKIFNDNSVM